jgi:alpha-glucoside transport system substrate-binding protein
MFPQPGLMADLVRGGYGVALDGDLLEAVEANYSDTWQALGMVDDEPYAVWYKASVKSVVWYPVEPFTAAGYEIPETWDELIALSDTIAATGTTPWCVGIEDSGATGWVATDWVEELMLRLHGADVYDQWVSHEIPFDDPRVVEAVEAMGEIWLNEDYVFGGTPSILTTPFGDSPSPMFDDPPNCFLHRQGTFISTFFPEDVQETLAGDDPASLSFYFPAVDAGDQPVLGTGDAAVMMNDRPEVRAVMAYLATPESGVGWAQAGGYFSPHAGFDASLYPTQADQIAQDILINATAFRYDGSDLMPGEVGAGTFWTAMVDYVNGASAEEVLAEVEASWPS